MFYGVLQREPSDDLIKGYNDLKGDKSDIGKAFSILSDLSKEVPVILGMNSQICSLVSEGELLPFGSFYITGFLHDKPLASIRRDLNAIGIKRGDVLRSEDHIAGL